jgi:hypothetical protein
MKISARNHFSGTAKNIVKGPGQYRGYGVDRAGY